MCTDVTVAAMVSTAGIRPGIRPGIRLPPQESSTVKQSIAWQQ